VTFEEFIKQCQAKKFAPLYLFLGAEKFLHQEALTALKTNALDEAAWMFNYAEISVAAEGLSAVTSAAEQYPMFGDRRIVVARDFEKLSDGELDLLKTYLKNPPATTTLVFQAETIDKRRNVATALIKGCTQIDLSPLKERDAAEWAIGYLRRAGYQMASNTAGLLIGLTGADLFTIRNELEKLMASLGRAGLITPQQVELLVARSREHSAFELGDAIIAGEPKRVLRLLVRQLADHAEPVMLLGMLARVFRQMLLAKELMKQKAPPDEIAREIGMPPFRIGDFLTNVRRWDTAKIERAIKRMAEVDNALKSSLGKPDLQLEFFICEVLNN
jgi:DNA polymerase III subunit delta